MTQVNQNQSTELVATSDIPNIADMLQKSKSLDKLKPVIKLTSKYIELEKVGESFRGIYAGLSEITVTDKETGELKTIPAVRFIVKGEMVVNAGAVLVNEIQKSNVPQGTPLEVTYSRKEKDTKIYELTLIG